MRLDDELVRWTIIPEVGSQVWAYVVFFSLRGLGMGFGGVFSVPVGRLRFTTIRVASPSHAKVRETERTRVRPVELD